MSVTAPRGHRVRPSMALAAWSIRSCRARDQSVHVLALTRATPPQLQAHLLLAHIALASARHMPALRAMPERSTRGERSETQRRSRGYGALIGTAKPCADGDAARRASRARPLRGPRSACSFTMRFPRPPLPSDPRPAAVPLSATGAGLALILSCASMLC